MRATDGTLTLFDAPGAGVGSGQGTFPMTNNPANAIVGYYVDNNNVWHGFVAEVRLAAAGPQRKFSTSIRSLTRVSSLEYRIVRPSGETVRPY